MLYTVAMSLGTRLTLKTAVLVLAVVVVAGVALWGLGGLNRKLDAALGEYDRLRESYALMSEVERARAAVRDPGATPASVERVLLRPVLHLDRPTTSAALPKALRDELRADLDDAIHTARGYSDYTDTPLDVTAPINAAISRLASDIDDTAGRIESIEQRAEVHRRSVVLWVGLTAAFAAVLAVIVGVWQYLAVMRPLCRLERGVARLASGDFADRLSATGDREFVRLADDFNRMADELAALYQQLEDKVRLRSAQLAQSERLASVGFLAAGVAHEINNPLAIIAGEAELALGALPKDGDTPAHTALTAIRDEAFRCKAITQKLISLARPGSGVKEPVDLRALAREIAELVRSLPQHKDRTVEVQADETAFAQTDAAQVKQVVLNLVINALEAVRPGTGRVRVVVDRSGSSASILVEDNGRGMDADTLERVFQPFYTEKKSPGTPGLGLGLSISHAIIEDLGGSLTAHSDGPGRGSLFTIELPGTDAGTTD